MSGWERNRRIHFNDIVEDYDAIRPEYPKQLFEDIRNYCRPAAGKTAVEIGAGTGKATAPMLSSGYDVTAIEMSPNMAEFLRERFACDRGFGVINTTFEEAELAENSYDLIYAGSAFHWVDAKIGLPKATKILKKDGAIALFRYNLIANCGEPVYEEIQKAYDAYYYSIYEKNAKPERKTTQDFVTPSEIKKGYGFENLSEYGFGDIKMNFYDAEMIYRADQYVSLMNTMSDCRALPEKNRNGLFDGIKEVILRHGNEYRVKYIFQLYMGRK